ncbi:MAG TPA: peptidylprolyl isomerase [Xanthobacteraceae bacterium]
MKKVTQLLKEPLLQFLVIGAVLFGAYAWLNRGGDDAGQPQVRLAESDVRWLKETFALERQRTPDDEELAVLVRGFVKEEMLARQAQALGLDKDDIVVRRRLAQKMTFLLQDNSARAEPSEDDLHRLYDAQRSRPQSPQGETRTLFTRPKISFAQIFFGRATRVDAAADARAALAELSRADAAAPLAGIGDQGSIKSEFHNVDARAVANQLGTKFAAAVFDLTPGAWQGPIESSQGVHLVRVTALVPGELRPFEEVKGELVEMWHEQTQRESEERYFVGLLKKYRIVPDASVKALVDPLIAEAGGEPIGARP